MAIPASLGLDGIRQDTSDSLHPRQGRPVWGEKEETMRGRASQATGHDSRVEGAGTKGLGEEEVVEDSIHVGDKSAFGTDWQWR